MTADASRQRHGPESRIAAALVGLLGATQSLLALADRADTRWLLAKEERDAHEIALARNQLSRVLQRIDTELDESAKPQAAPRMA